MGKDCDQSGQPFKKKPIHFITKAPYKVEKAHDSQTTEGKPNYITALSVYCSSLLCSSNTAHQPNPQVKPIQHTHKFRVVWIFNLTNSGLGGSVVGQAANCKSIYTR